MNISDDILVYAEDEIERVSQFDTKFYEMLFCKKTCKILSFYIFKRRYAT